MFLTQIYKMIEPNLQTLLIPQNFKTMLLANLLYEIVNEYNFI